MEKEQNYKTSYQNTLTRHTISHGKHQYGFSIASINLTSQKSIDQFLEQYNCQNWVWLRLTYDCPQDAGTDTKYIFSNPLLVVQLYFLFFNIITKKKFFFFKKSRLLSGWDFQASNFSVKKIHNVTKIMRQTFFKFQYRYNRNVCHLQKPHLPPCNTIKLVYKHFYYNECILLQNKLHSPNFNFKLCVLLLWMQINVQQVVAQLTGQLYCRCPYPYSPYQYLQALLFTCYFEVMRDRIQGQPRKICLKNTSISGGQDCQFVARTYIYRRLFTNSYGQEC
ncbi:unnamed protein product [Paramecium octaurelia]|uniref:Transmembrane protein n=1 Tax=Paramecium octaurelia TaxID=43137 RepID=A0A8S1YMR3_PAROT|nr:unnamed protein product [Paramecium octaurelia]